MEHGPPRTSRSPSASRRSGDELVTKLLTAAKAGNPPDLVQAEYQALPTLVSNDALADIKPSTAPVKAEFADGVWQPVTLGTDAVYAIPQDTGPMMLYYREDLFNRLGLTVPEDLGRVRRRGPHGARRRTRRQYLEHVLRQPTPAGSPAWPSRPAPQWWGVNGETLEGRASTTRATKKVADYWGGLVKEGVIDNQPMYTPEWNKALNDGTLLAWPSARSGRPGVLSGNAPDTKGKWAIAPLPQWNAGENVTGSWGGSSTAVTARLQAQARRRPSSPPGSTPTRGASTALVKEGGIYPAATTAQSGRRWPRRRRSSPTSPTSTPGGQAIAGDRAPASPSGPNVNVAYSAYKDAFAKAITDKTRVRRRARARCRRPPSTT